MQRIQRAIHRRRDPNRLWQGRVQPLPPTRRRQGRPGGAGQGLVRRPLRHVWRHGIFKDHGRHVALRVSLRRGDVCI